MVNVKSNFKSFIKGEGIRILRNTSNEIEFHKRIKPFTEKLKVRGYKIQMIKNILSEINFKDRQEKLKKKIKCENMCNITFITHYHPKVEILQRIIGKHWHLIKNDPTIGTKFKKNLNYWIQKKQKHWRISETSQKINLIIPARGATLCTRHAHSKYNIDNRKFTIQCKNGR